MLFYSAKNGLLVYLHAIAQTVSLSFPWGHENDKRKGKRYASLGLFSLSSPPAGSVFRIGRIFDRCNSISYLLQCYSAPESLRNGSQGVQTDVIFASLDPGYMHLTQPAPLGQLYLCHSFLLADVSNALTYPLTLVLYHSLVFL